MRKERTGRHNSICREFGRIFREAVFHTPGLGLNRNLQTAIIIARIGHLGRKPGALFHLFVFAFFFSACRTGSSLLSFGGFNIQLTVSPAL